MKSATALFLSVVTLSGLTEAGDKWVVPGYFVFGSCGSYGGGARAPLVNNGQKYYSRASCNFDYIERDPCHSQAKSIEHILRVNGQNSGCFDWLNNQLSECRSFARNAAQYCNQLN